MHGFYIFLRRLLLYSFTHLKVALCFQFFKPMNPVNVVIHYNNDGRASGEADVDFATHEEAQEAMTKDRASMSKCMICRSYF